MQSWARPAFLTIYTIVRTSEAGCYVLAIL